MAMTGLQLENHPLWSKVRRGKDLQISDMARLRGRLDSLQIEDGVWLCDFVVLTLEAPLHLGKRAKLMPHVIVNAHKPVTICAGAKIGGHVQILGGYHTPDGFESGNILIGTGAVIGPGAILGPGTTIEQNGRVAANSVIGIDWNERPSAVGTRAD